MIWPAFIAELEARALGHLPEGVQAAVRAVVPLGDAGLTVLLSCGTGHQLEQGEGDDYRLGAVTSMSSVDSGIDIFAPAEDPELVTLGALLAGRHPSPLLDKLAVRRTSIRSWRPCRRAQIELAIAESPVAYFLKFERPAKAGRWERLRNVLARELDRSQVIAMAEPAGADSEHGLSIARQVSGVPLSEHLAAADAAAVLHRVGQALRDLEPLAADPPLAALLPRYDFASARADLGRFTRLLTRLAMPTATLVSAGADRLEAFVQVDSGRRALIHRDLHDRQIMIGNRITLLDLEGASLGDPALDFGNLLAHLRLRHLQGRLADSPERLRTALLAGHGGGVSGDWQRATSAFEVLSLFRLAAVYDLRPRWRHLGVKLARAGHSILDAIVSPATTASAIS
jgi:Phosphotransferase enzyme family